MDTSFHLLGSEAAPDRCLGFARVIKIGFIFDVHTFSMVGLSAYNYASLGTYVVRG
jgi:hypothetical protein